MPRACSTLLQNIFAQNPDFHATSTDGLIELLGAARDAFSTKEEFKTQLDQELSRKAWINFCRKGIEGYSETLTNKPNIIIKARGWKGVSDWAGMMLGYDPIIIVMVRNLKSIVSSFEKLYKNEPEKASKYYLPDQLRGTTLFKRVDMYLNNAPLALDLDRLYELIRTDVKSNIVFVRAEDLTSMPSLIMSEIYNKLGMLSYKHNFEEVDQLVNENDAIHGIKDLHKIKTKVTPLQDDYNDILGEEVCNYIDSEYKWYQNFFQYL